MLQAIVIVVLGLLSASAHAGGFAITEHGGRGLGSAWAGEAALAEDARTIYFNPAGMTLLRGTQIVGGMDGIRTSGTFENEGSHVNRAAGGGPLRGNDGGDGGALGSIPSLYISHQLLDRVWIGLGVDAPFGLRTDWDPGWVGRYNAVVSDLKSVNVNPSIAVRLLDTLSFGAGFNAQYAHVKLTNFLDLGTLCVVQQGFPLATCEGLGLGPQKADAFVKLVGNSWGYGWNVGTLWEPRPGTHLGLTYRSRIQHELTGDADFTVPAKAKPLIKPTGQLRDTGAVAPVEFPDSASFAAFQQVTRRLAVMADVTWTHWDRFTSLAVNFDNPKQTDFDAVEDWRNTFRVALGARFDLDDRWSLRAGFAWDQTTVTSPANRDPRIPDSDRYWLAFGAGYQLTPSMRVDAGYAHIFLPNASTRNRDAVSGNVLRGEFSSQADLIGMQATLTFD
ncbi:MAG TPA: outer membrane protein transport protein [Candidatus Binatia bacterium]|jgi:long-chain fatty acid transport protein|nr:outer membrane protein transport protein [Candidatus Binatia bacterium]